MRQRIWRLGLILAAAPATLAAARPPAPVIKMPCRDMGDGRTLVDSAYFPDGYDAAKGYAILAKRPTSMQGGWANRVCTVRLKR